MQKFLRKGRRNTARLANKLTLSILICSFIIIWVWPTQFADDVLKYSQEVQRKIENTLPNKPYENTKEARSKATQQKASRLSTKRPLLYTWI